MPETEPLGQNTQRAHAVLQPHSGALHGLRFLIAAAVLSQVGHHGPDPGNRVNSGVAAVAPARSIALSPEEREQLVRVLTDRVQSCAGMCSTMEALQLAQVCGEQPLSGEKLSKAASELSPQLRSAVHGIAEILREHPDLAPETLTALHGFIDSLPMTDPRRIAAMVIPKQDDRLLNAPSIRWSAETFLDCEEDCGAYTRPRIASNRVETAEELTRYSE